MTALRSAELESTGSVPASDESPVAAGGDPTTMNPPQDGPAAAPTPRELEVLALVERGLTTRAIAERLLTTPRTIYFHVGNLFAKLGARSRTEMVYLARQRGWLE